MTECSPRRIGLLAGWGRYPVLIAEALHRQGHQVFCMGIVGHADPRLAEICDGFQWGGMFKLGLGMRYMRRQGVTDVVMAGKFHKVVFFQPWVWLRHLPDWGGIRMLAPFFLTRRKHCNDDSLLGAVVDAFAREGMRFGPPTDYVPELLVGHGPLTRKEPSAWQWKDIRYGWRLAKEMGRLDVGQSVVVKDQTAIAIEAVEGTDECIRRAGDICRAGRFTVVKVAKPQQDMRFDVPTIGMRTVETIAAAGGRVLAIEAGRTILLDAPEVIDFADRKGLVIVAVADEG